MFFNGQEHFEGHAIAGKPGKQKRRRHRQQQQRKELHYSALDRGRTVGEPDKQWPVTDRMDVADEKQTRSITQPHSTFVVARHSFIGEGWASQVLSLQLVVAQKHLALRRQYLHVAVEPQYVFGIVMVLLMEYQTPVGRKGEQAFRGFNILYLCVVQAAAELPIFQPTLLHR